MALVLVIVSGSIYGPSGDKLTTGLLTFTPTKPISNGGHLVSSAASISVSGAISFALSPSFGIPYTVVLDPDPSNTGTPTPLKPGYFKKTILIPTVGSIDIATLLS